MKTTTILIFFLTYVTATSAVAVPSPAAMTTAVGRGDTSPGAQVPVGGNSWDDSGDDGEEASCFCAGTSICCRKNGEVDCGYGLCGVWI